MDFDTSKKFTVKVDLPRRFPRLDAVLLEELRKQDRSLTLKHISRAAFKNLFYDKRVQIKGQNAKPSSSLETGTTVIDILGFVDGD